MSTLKMVYLKLLTICTIIITINCNAIKYSKPLAIMSQEKLSGYKQNPSIRPYQITTDENVDSSNLSELQLPKEDRIFPVIALQLPYKDSYNFFVAPPLKEGEERNDKNNYEYLEMLQPPPINNNEPNYFALKPRKQNPKKFTTNTKQLNIKQQHSEALPLTDDENRYNEGRKFENIYDYDDRIYNLDDQYFVPDAISDQTQQQNGNQEYNKQIQQTEPQQVHQQVQIPQQVQLSQHEQQPEEKLKFDLPERDRIDFQMHNYDGPKSYKFGYDTGKGKNRQFRFEERDRDGNVVGQYGYLDKKGNMNIIKYTSKADGGFLSEKAA